MNTPDVTILQVFTTPQTVAKDSGKELVRVDARNGKNPDGTKREVAAADRTRCIIIPELTIAGVPSKYESLLLQALRDIAAEQLRESWAAEPQLREVQAASYSVDSLLAYSARVAESKRMTKAGLETWFNDSALCKRLMQLGNSAKLAEWKSLILGMAAPTCTIQEMQCLAVIATIGKDDTDADSPIGQQIIDKMTKRIAACKEVAAVIDAV